MSESSVLSNVPADDDKREVHQTEVDPDVDPTKTTVLSKRQRKKLEKRRLWLEQKPQRKAREKEKRKTKILMAKETGKDLGPTRKRLKELKMCDSACKLRVCFDMSLADLMTEAEFSKTLKQLNRCYAINRRSDAPLQLYLTGYSDSSKVKMEKLSGCFKWDVNLDSILHTSVFEKKEIVYLTSDSPNVLGDLDHSKVYVIGALVDHNRLKNISFESAEASGIDHARFPLDGRFKFKTRKVLTIDQVYLILLRLTEGKSWVDAVMETVPKRKGVELCTDVEDSTQEKNESSDST